MTASEAGLARTALLFGLCHEMFSFALGVETYWLLYGILASFSRAKQYILFDILSFYDLGIAFYLRM